jgi:hypothetical protein
MKKIFVISWLLIIALLATSSFAAAAPKPAGNTTGEVVKAWVIGPEGLLVTVGSHETGEITVETGDRLIIMGMAKKVGKDPLSFNLFKGDPSGGPLQQVVTQVFKDKAKKQAKNIHYKFTPDQVTTGIPYTFRFNITNSTGAELDWSVIRINVTDS